MLNCLSMLFKAVGPQFGTLTFWRVDIYFAVGFWDWSLRCQHSPIFPTSASWLLWGLPAWLCGFSCFWHQVHIVIWNLWVFFVSYLKYKWSLWFFCCSFSFHFSIALFLGEGERFRIQLPPCSSRIIINMFVILKIWKMLPYLSKVNKEWTFHVEIWYSKMDPWAKYIPHCWVFKICSGYNWESNSINLLDKQIYAESLSLSEKWNWVEEKESDLYVTKMLFFVLIDRIGLDFSISMHSFPIVFFFFINCRRLIRISWM